METPTETKAPTYWQPWFQVYAGEVRQAHSCTDLNAPGVRMQDYVPIATDPKEPLYDTARVSELFATEREAYEELRRRLKSSVEAHAWCLEHDRAKLTEVTAWLRGVL